MVYIECSVKNVFCKRNVCCVDTDCARLAIDQNTRETLRSARLRLLVLLTTGPPSQTYFFEKKMVIEYNLNCRIVLLFARALRACVIFYLGLLLKELVLEVFIYGV